MKKYQFEFDKFVKDLENRYDRYRQKLLEDSNDENEQDIKRLKAKRYHEHPHNSITYGEKQK